MHTATQHTRTTPTKKQMKQIDTYLLYHTPGYGWMTANPHIFDEINSMDAMQAIQLTCRLFRYHRLNQMKSGNWTFDEAKEQRRRRWIEAIKQQARMISRQTNISYNKIFHLLFNRMLEELTR